jgi:phosphoglycerate-specific signal transduction histidine kinase
MTTDAVSGNGPETRRKSAKRTAGPRATGQPEGEPPVSLEALGLGSADTLRQQLDYGLSFLASCEAMLRESRGDPTKPIFSAAAIMRANVSTALAIAPAARGETRHRSISETILPPDRKKEEAKKTARTKLETAEARLRVTKRMDELVNQSIRARMGETTELDRVGMIVKSEEKLVDYLKKTVAELD